jgi:hypothetical protein
VSNKVANAPRSGGIIGNQCRHERFEWASAHAQTYAGKPWRYALIPHDAIAENVTVPFLLKQYG